MEKKFRDGIEISILILILEKVYFWQGLLIRNTPRHLWNENEKN